MSRLIIDTWNALRPMLQANRTAILVVPSCSYRREILAFAKNDPHCVGYKAHLPVVKLNDINATLRFVVQPSSNELFTAIHRLVVGQRNSDLWLVDTFNVGAPVRNDLLNLMAVHDGSFNVLVK